MKKTVLPVIVLIFAGFVFFHFREVRALRDTTTALKIENEQLKQHSRTPPPLVETAPAPKPALPTNLAQRSTPLPQATRITSFGDKIPLPNGGQIGFTPDNPQEQRQRIERARAEIAKNYESLFTSLEFTSAQKDQFISMIMDSRDSRIDLFRKAASGLPNRDATTFQDLAQITATETRKELAEKMRTAFGDTKAAAIAEYERILPVTTLIEKYTSTLASTNAPLTASQTEQLHATLARHAYDAAGNFTLRDNSELIAWDAAKFLSPEQFALLMKTQNAKRTN